MRLAQADHRVLSEMTKTIAETDRGGGLPGRCWTDRDQIMRADGRIGCWEPVEVDLRFGLSVWLKSGVGHTDGRRFPAIGRRDAACAISMSVSTMSPSFYAPWAARAFSMRTGSR